MAPFAGVSVVTSGEPCYCLDSNADDAGTEGSGYHLLVVHGFSNTTTAIPTGQNISSRPFKVGGHRWCVMCYPSGKNATYADFVSLDVCLLEDDSAAEEPVVEARFGFSFVDETERQKPSYVRATQAYRFSGGTPTWGCERFVKRSALEGSVHLRGDHLTIRCDILVRDSGADADIGLHLQGLLQTKVGADVRFEVGGETFTAHRCLLASRSTVFMAQLFGPMKEGTTSSVIQIKDMEARVFRALLSFIYTDSLPKMEIMDTEEEAGDDVTWLHDLLVAADRYDLKRLKFLCEKQLSEQISVSTVTSTMALAERHHRRGLKKACFQFLRVQSPSRLKTIMASDGWKHIAMTYPSVLSELIAELVSSNQKLEMQMDQYYQKLEMQMDQY